ncbi:hypothetical protein GmHk_17G049849 [Glycine max]|nr:hypothetical protein GmHk_17G049849 [Glycine max]
MQATYWQVVSFQNEHYCFRTVRNSQATPEWVSKRLMSLLMHSPDMRLKALVAFALEKWGFRLSMDQAYRAKVKAIEKIEGATRDQYKHLRSYVAELLDKNKNSTMKIKYDLSPHDPIFERMYVCLKACKSAFVTTCRSLVGLDGCFLKGEFGGQLLTAVGKDGNSQMFPIAYGIVESKNYSSCKWFIDQLIVDLDGIQEGSWAFISDQQKGLVKVIKELGENVEHRLCVKHLYGNWKKKYPGEHMKELMWMAARATTTLDWEKAMLQIKNYDEEAWNDLQKLNPTCWTRKSTVLTTYSFIVYPCNGPNLWPPLQTPVMLPPIMRRAPGRPKKARNKKNDESTKRPYLPRQSRSVVCKNCKAIGHNRRTCKGKTSTDRTIPKGGNKNLKRQSPCPTPVVAKKQNIGPSTSQTPSVGHQQGDSTSETQ